VRIAGKAGGEPSLLRKRSGSPPKQAAEKYWIARKTTRRVKSA
jgi:hypothetical protein